MAITPTERAAIELETRQECARIASLESQYWGSLGNDSPHISDISIGAMGASANICAAIFMGKTAAQAAEEIRNRAMTTAGAGLGYGVSHTPEGKQS